MNRCDFTFSCRTKTLSGRKALDHLPFDLWGTGVRKPMVLQDKNACDLNLVKPLARAFQASGMVLGISFPIEADRDVAGKSDLEILRDLYQIYTDRGFDGIIALGTGRVADMAKALNIAVSLGLTALMERDRPLKISAPLSPWVYISTGVGTALETGYSARFDHKRFASSFLGPDFAVIDPVVLRTEEDSARLLDAGLTALCTGCQVYACSHNPPAGAYAATVVRQIMENLLPLLTPLMDAEPARKNRAHKKEMAVHLANLVHASVISGYLSATADTLTGVETARRIAKHFNLSFGVAMAVLLPSLLELCDGDDARVGKLLLPLVGQARFAAVPTPLQRAGAIHEFQSLLHEIHRMSRGRVPRTLRDVGMDRDKVAMLLHEGADVEKKVPTDASARDLEQARAILTHAVNNGCTHPATA